MSTASPERARQIAEVAKAASECETKERGYFVEQACGGDAELRAEVNSLLRFHDAGDGVFEKGALHLVAGSLTSAPSIEAGQQVGEYRIMSLIGAGGMGDVYLAEDLELRRKVALKLVRAGIGNDDLAARFRHEEQILASLNHPNIAQLHGYGRTQSGTPFFVMEYVQGDSITDFCKARKLSISDRLRLFQKVCGAVHYAHQHLVIHRDLKPSNILVTEAGEPKLLDFGIAKLIEGEDSPVTRAVTMTVFGLMTPEYASPEQVRGDPISTATDIYSLGVVLYELLTNQRPYRTKSRRPDEIARAVTDEEPQRPSTAAAGSAELRFDDLKSLRGDLDNIMLMALRKEPQRRYSSVAQFSDDIRRYLEGRPVVAHKDTLGYRAKKFVRRNRAPVAAGAALLLAIVAGSVAIAWQARVATRERDRAQKRFNDVRHLSNALLTEIAPLIERLEGATEARQALVRQSVAYLDSLAAESADDAGLQTELAAAYEKVAALQGAPQRPNLGDFSGAIASYDKAHAIRQRRASIASGDFENRRAAAGNRREVAAIRFWINDFPGALRDAEKALHGYGQLLTERPGDVGVQLGWAETNLDIAQTHSRNQRYKEAYKFLEEPLTQLEQLRAADGANAETLRLLGRGYTILAIALSWDDQPARAEAEMAKGIAINESLVAAQPNDVILRQGLWFTYLQASSLYEETGDPTKDLLSEEFAHKALQMALGTVEKDPANTQARQSVGQSHSKLAVSAANLNKTSEAIVHAEKALEVFTRLERNEPGNLTYKRNVGIACTRLGDAKNRQGDLAGALRAFERSVTAFEAIVRADATNRVSQRDIAQALKNIGNIHRELARADRSQAADHTRHAKESYARAVVILEELQQQNALPAIDRKLLSEVQTAAQTP